MLTLFTRYQVFRQIFHTIRIISDVPDVFRRECPIAVFSGSQTDWSLGVPQHHRQQAIQPSTVWCLLLKHSAQ